MDPSLKEVIDAIPKLIGAVGVVVAGIGLWNSARVRSEDLRWRKATAAHDILDEIRAHPLASVAVAIMDCHLGQYAYDADNPAVGFTGVTLDQALRALAAAGGGEARERYMYRCFDWFFYYLDRIGYLRARGFVQADDVAGPLSPYARLLLEHKPEIDPLLNAHAYSNVLRLLEEVVRQSGAPSQSSALPRGDGQAA